MLLTFLFLVSVTLVLWLYLHSYRIKNYWKKRGIPYLEPVPILGNAKEWILGNVPAATWFKNLYNSSDDPYVGIFVFWTPRLIVKSPEIIKQIMVKDFENFPDRSFAISKHDKISSNMMFIQRANLWKPMRKRLSPLFSTGKVKGMFPVLTGVGEEMVSYISKNIGVLEAKSVAGRYTTETTCLTFFGAKAYAFEGESLLHQLAMQMNTGNFSNALRRICYVFLHEVVSLLRLNLFMGKIQGPLVDILLNVVNERRENNIVKNDFVDILIDIMKDEEFCKAHQFFGKATGGPPVQIMFASHETTSSAIAFTLYELAVHPEIQEKCRKSILNVMKNHDSLTYEAFKEMNYLEMCAKETLRKYPQLLAIDRRCEKDYVIPGTDILIKKNETVSIPVICLHFDEKYFPEPDRYMPERFEKKVNVGGLYYLPFGEGPRGCIGERLGLMNVQICLVYILRNFVVEICPKTPVPLEFDRKATSFISKKGLPLNFRRI